MILLLLACSEDPEAPEPEAPCVPATADEILEVRGRYYTCLDRSLAGGAGCGSDGYPLGYGGKYAERYLADVHPQVTPAGQLFLETVSICLQERMHAWVTPDAPCDQVWDEGFASHPDCYVESGFCDLPIDDMLAIADAVDPQDEDLTEARTQAAEVALRCASGG